MKIIVYHGATEIVENPICAFGRKNLDFGQGFYVTDIKEQAVKWSKLIAQKRKGLNPSAGYDYIEGGVADDRVIDTVNLYMSGLMSSDIALQRLAMHCPNNQICLLNQSLTDKYLEYDGTEPAE